MIETEPIGPLPHGLQNEETLPTQHPEKSTNSDLGKLAAGFARPKSGELEAREIIKIGSRVDLRDTDDNETFSCIIASNEDDSLGSALDVDIVSPSSPLGNALLGLIEGSVVSWHLPNGGTMHAEVIKVYPPEE